ncbi:MAG: OmpA family protein [Bradymonadales bacterium]|nr:OmpA family protein [Bradymonadales bacterium]
MATDNRLKVLDGWRWRGAVPLLASSIALFLLAPVGCATGQRLKTRADYIESTAERIHDAAYNCAERELALGESHLDFGKYELSRGNFTVADDHLEVAYENINAAAAIVDARPECWPDYVADSDGDGLLDDVDQCPYEPEDFDGFEDEDGCPDYDNDGDGIPDVDDLCPNDPEDFDGFEDEDGCPDPDNDTDRVCDPWVAELRQSAQYAATCRGIDRCPDEYGEGEDGCPVRHVTVTETQIRIDQQIHFETDSARIMPDSFGILDEVAEVLRSRPTMHIRIEGHTDHRGSSRYNLRLSDSRAASVRTYLIRAGIDPSRMISVGYGEERPIDTNNTEAGMANNRRVEFHIVVQ